MFRIVHCLGIIAGLSACGPPEGGLADRSAAILGGEYDPDHDAAVVVAAGNSICTGTLIGRSVVLTAAHCFETFESGAVVVYFGDQIYGPLGMYQDVEIRDVEEVQIHPDYNASSNRENDLALVRLFENAPRQVEPIPVIPEEQAVTSLDVGSSMLLAGFGVTDPGDSSTAGHRRSVDKRLRWVCSSPGGCVEPVDGAWFDINENSLCFDYTDGGACFGDSGGPALMLRDQTEYLAGVGSLGGEDCQGYSCYTQVDAYLEFIHGFASEMGTPCEADNRCWSGYCTDGVCCRSHCGRDCQSCNQPGLVGECTFVEEGCCGCQTRTAIPPGVAGFVLLAGWLLLRRQGSPDRGG